jgi:hypothetical protein
MSKKIIPGLAWVGSFVFSLALPFILIVGVEALSPNKASWLASISFARAAMLSGLPLVWWLLFILKNNKVLRVLAAVLLTLIYVFWSFTVQEIPSDL